MSDLSAALVTAGFQKKVPFLSATGCIKTSLRHLHFLSVLASSFHLVLVVFHFISFFYFFSPTISRFQTNGTYSTGFFPNFAHSIGEGRGEREESGHAWSLKPAVEIYGESCVWFEWNFKTETFEKSLKFVVLPRLRFLWKTEWN